MVLVSRRRVLRTTLTVGTGGLAGCVFGFGGESGCSDGRTMHETDVALSQTAGWPTYQYDARNSGYNPDASGPTDAELAWRYSACTEAESGVVVSGGDAYAGGLAVDGQTGRSRGGEWHGHMSTPTVADGTLYMGASDLEARDATTGETEWTFQTDTDAGSLPAPKVSSGTVYVPGSIDDSTLYAVDADTGTERWRFGVETDIEVPIAVADETVYAVDEQGTLYVLDAVNGDERWRVSRGGSGRVPPVVADGRVYLGSNDGGVHALRTSDGSVLWQQDGIGGSIAVTPETVLVAGEETVAALASATGRIEWRSSTPLGEPVSPAVADGVVYVGETEAVSGEGSPAVVALDATGGDELWRVETREVLFGDYTRAGIVGGPAVVDGAVYAATAPGDLYAITG